MSSIPQEPQPPTPGPQGSPQDPGHPAPPPPPGGQGYPSPPPPRGYSEAPGHDQAPQYGQPPPSGPPPGYGQAPGYGPPSGYGAGGPVSEMEPSQQRLWACLAHLSSIVAGLVLTPFTGGIVYLGAVGPLVIFLVLKDRGIFVRRQSVEALNFQILLTVVYVAGALLSVVTLGIGLFVTVPLLLIFGIVALVLQIIAAVKANQGVDHRYPFSWRMVK